MNLRIASPADNQALVEFYKNFTLPGQVEIKIDRMHDYFAPYNIQSDRHVTYILEDQGQLFGTASFVIQNLKHQGQLQPVAWGRDLRIANSRQAILSWSQHFLPVLEEVKKTFHAQLLFSIINMDDKQALNAFVRPRPSKRPLPRYYLYRRFNLVSLHGQLPWAKNPLPHLHIKHAQPHHFDALAGYIIEKSKEKELSSISNYQSFQEKLSRFSGLSLDNFLIAVDRFNNIVGCVAPWSSANIQEYIPLRYELRGHNFRQFLKFGEQLGWTRSLTKPVHRLNKEASFNFRYLNFLFADNEDVFQSLLWSAYENVLPNEFLLYAHLRSEIMFRRPLSWISSKRQYGIYLMCEPEISMPDFLHPRNELPIEIEPFFV